VSRRAIPVLAAVLIVVGLAGIVATWIFLGSQSPGERMGPGNVDAMFIQEMIPHHDDAIAMAEMAITRAEHPELAQLARDIERNQTEENAQMREWYREWFDSEVPEDGGSSRMMMSGGVDMEEVGDAEPFDKLFIEEMVPHHQMAIMMSTMLRNRSNRAEMRNLAESIIDTQSREIDQMQEWYDEWYRR